MSRQKMIEKCRERLREVDRSIANHYREWADMPNSCFAIDDLKCKKEKKRELEWVLAMLTGVA